MQPFIKKLFFLFFLLTFFNLSILHATTLTVSINSSSNDAEEDTSDGSVNRSSSDLELVQEGEKQIVGLRFLGITIAPGSIITSAYLTFEADESDSEATSLTIFGQDNSSSDAFGSGANDISIRSKTNGVTWSPTAWSTGTSYTSSDIATVIQQIINRSDWVDGNALTLIIEGNGKRVAESFNGDGDAPQLTIVYTEAANPTATDDNVTTFTASETIIPVLDNDAAGKGFTIDTSTVTITSNPTNGSVVVNGTGTISYTSNANYAGTDTFSYTFDNSKSPAKTSNIATVTINVTAGSLTCVDYDSDSTDTNTILFLDNVSVATIGCITGASNNGDSNSADYYTFTAGEHGVLTVTTSSPNSHDYHLSIGSSRGTNTHYGDITAQSHTITPISIAKDASIYFYIKETGSNEDEYQLDFSFALAGFNANDDSVQTNPDINATFNILENDSPGQDGHTIDTTSVTIVTNPTNGSLVVNADGTVDYDPNTSYTGDDSFTYTVNNSNGDTSNIATVNITVGFIVGDRDFEIRNPSDTRNIRGNYIVGGNINLCTYDEDTGDDPTSTGNSKPWNGECYFTTSNSHPTNFVDIDGDASTVNSSSFELNLPDNSTVVWAGLYWQGVVHNSLINEDFMDYETISGATLVQSSRKQINLASDNNGNGTYDAEKVKFKVPNGAYEEVTAQQLDFSGLGYAGFLDVTSRLNATDANGVYTLADIKAHQGTETNHGNYAGWSLVVIYENEDEDFRNITLFDGFVTVTSSYNGDLVMDGFLTPKVAPVKSKLAFFTMDGDNGTNSLTITSAGGVTTEVVDVNSSSGDSLFNSSINGVYNRNPDYPSARMDLDIIDIEDFLGTYETSATLKPRSGGDRYTASFFILSSDLYVPNFCYDYSYKQDGKYFTEDNPDDTLPHITGDITSSEIEVTLYLRNDEDSDIVASNMYMEITDINTTQASYYRSSDNLGSVYLNSPNEIIPTRILDTNLDIGTNSIKDITIGDIDSLEYFYLYYNLLPGANIETIDMPINAKVYYDLTIDVNGSSLSLEYSTTLSDKIQLCSTDNFKYGPTTGIFNVVHNDYYNLDTGGTSKYYNLPTQVVKREGNFKVLALDEDDHNVLEGKNTIVAVELIDAAAFHDTKASCQEPSSSISEKVWVLFENNATSTSFNQTALIAAVADNRTDLNLSSDFYNYARQNAAFRVSYNLTNDGNNSLVQIEEGSQPNTYSINFTELVQGLGTCSSDMDGILNNSDQVAQWCGNNSDHLTQEDIAICMQCVYGYNTRFVCSQDNFAIRPEAFQLSLNDQNQETALDQVPITPNYSGTTTASAPELNLASGYDYNLSVTATNHIDNVASNGYTQNLGASSSEFSSYTWQTDNGGVTYSTCNDDANQTVNISVYNGAEELNTSMNQVGEYKLSLLDTSWTAVDNDPESTSMLHHKNNPYFFPIADCVQNTSSTQVVNSLLQNGCEIRSLHTNPSNSFIYNSFDITFHPYKFLVTNITTLGLNNSTVTGVTDPYIYMADITQDINMSVQLNTVISAQGENNTSLSNFVQSCYAKNINLDISKSTMSNTDLTYNYFLRDKNSTGAIISSNDINVTLAEGADLGVLSMATSNTFFQKDMNGKIDTTTYLNFSRETNASANPEKITFTTYEVSDPNNSFIADSNNGTIRTKTAEGYADINKSTTQRLDVTHYYAKAHTGRQRFQVPGDNPYTTNIHYQLYCYGTLNGNTCTPTWLQNSTNLKRVNDIRWYINPNHTTAKDGNITSVIQSNSVTTVTPSALVVNNPTTVNLLYDGSRGYPYKTNMDINPSSWLIYDKYNFNATVNEFSVEYEQDGTSWSGENETSTTTQDTGSIRTNRRSMW